jgi:hypothetical protein
MVRLVDLQCSFDALDSTKENGQCEHNNCNPESVPLDPVATIYPPLLDRGWARLIELLFQNDQPVMPESEVLDPPLCFSKLTAFDGFGIKDFGVGR